MATCKECLHYEACVLNEAYWVKHNADQACSVFKDKSKYVERNHGRWIEFTRPADRLFGLFQPYHKCSECEKDFIGGVDHGTNFCPNCGADMRCE